MWNALFVISNTLINQKLRLILDWIMARSKTWKTRKSFSEIFKSEFSILAIGQNRKLGNKKTRNNISEISEFSICHFSFFKKLFFSIFYSSNSVLSIYVLFSKPFKMFFPSPKIYVQDIPCRNKIYFLWGVSSLIRTWVVLILNSMRGFNFSHA